MNSSFKVIAETIGEITELKRRMRSLQDTLGERELQISALVAENNNLTNNVNSVSNQHKMSNQLTETKA